MARPEFKGIVWRNVYHMLCYSVKYISDLNLDDSDYESIKGVADLLGKILIEAHKYSLSYSKLTEYKPKTSLSTNPKGKLDIYKSTSTGKDLQGKLYHTHYTLDIDTIPNRIIKKAYEILLEAGRDRDSFSEETRASISYYLNLLRGVGELSRDDIVNIYNNNIGLDTLQNWHKPVIAISQLIIRNSLLLDSYGKIFTFVFDNYKQLNLIFEEFVRSYISEAFAGTNLRVSRPVYKVSGGSSLHLDILCQLDQCFLVMDTKWYEHEPEGNANSNEVYRYAGAVERNNTSVNGEHRDISINALILYAKTFSWPIRHPCTNERLRDIELLIYERQLDLNKSFEEIQSDIVELVNETMPK